MGRRWAIPIAATLLFACWASEAAADVIVLKSGKKIEGRIVEEGVVWVRIEVRTSFSTPVVVSYRREDIDRIEKGKLPEDIYDDKVKQVKDDDAQAHFDLASWCLGVGLRDRGMKHLAQTLKTSREAKLTDTVLTKYEELQEWEILREHYASRLESDPNNAALKAKLGAVTTALDAKAAREWDKKIVGLESRISLLQQQHVAKTAEFRRLSHQGGAHEQHTRLKDELDQLERLAARLNVERMMIRIVARHTSGSASQNSQ